jgi:SAM-dependent methyltransferase
LESGLPHEKKSLMIAWGLGILEAMKDPTKRFSDRVDDYVKYRPHYHPDLIRVLKEAFGLGKIWTVADLGSGTGLSSERFLEYGCRVFGVEPNREMRAAAERLYARKANFRSLGGKAEATGIESESVDLYLAGQAFHWFDKASARAEALRILRAPKRALLMWNDWNAADTPFLRDYGAFLDARMPERSEANHRNLQPADFDDFFGKGRWRKTELANGQNVDFEGLKGRLLSASYAPKEGEPGFEETMAELKAVFDRHAVSGSIDFGYTTVLRFGEMAE